MEHHILYSLVDLKQKRWVNEIWTDDEVKRYASIIYDLYEYDPAPLQTFVKPIKGVSRILDIDPSK